MISYPFGWSIIGSDLSWDRDTCKSLKSLSFTVPMSGWARENGCMDPVVRILDSSWLSLSMWWPWAKSLNLFVLSFLICKVGDIGAYIIGSLWGVEAVPDKWLSAVYMFVVSSNGSRDHIILVKIKIFKHWGYVLGSSGPPPHSKIE